MAPFINSGEDIAARSTWERLAGTTSAVTTEDSVFDAVQLVFDAVAAKNARLILWQVFDKYTSRLDIVNALSTFAARQRDAVPVKVEGNDLRSATLTVTSMANKAMWGEVSALLPATTM